ncbi:hypothetical protein GYMLUDRAFT_230338 [Collybiopsis luxurians FD-317 M1]|uniref:DUF6534 domain-containing protein n=1 Tax=Collybiopsis luxurians FD-317 M1 TaxID=944289 RepID=A0A0D0AZS3_9AGAR|nr:hypothetical protein GYMLUDRAFT_230338 [Collybiopsis luxurians FD-317 M1]
MATTPLPANIEVIAGPLLLGYLFNWGLYGALAVQVYIYYMSFPKDRLAVKCLVMAIFAIETVQTILCAHDAFAAYASGFGNLTAVTSSHTEWFNTPILSGIVSCTVQLFYAYRISVLSGTKIWSIIIAATAITQGTAAIVQGVQDHLITDFAQLQKEAFASDVVWAVGSAVCDIMIACVMSYYLSRKDTGFKQTRVLVHKLVRLTIETGALTATCATVYIVLFIALPHVQYYLAVGLTLAKLYSNTLLLIFNSRVRVIGGRDTSQSTELIELQSSQERSRFQNIRRTSNFNANNVAVHVSREMMVDNNDIPNPKVFANDTGKDYVNVV